MSSRAKKTGFTRALPLERASLSPSSSRVKIILTRLSVSSLPDSKEEPFWINPVPVPLLRPFHSSRLALSAHPHPTSQCSIPRANLFPTRAPPTTTILKPIFFSTVQRVVDVVVVVWLVCSLIEKPVRAKGYRDRMDRGQDTRKSPREPARVEGVRG